jgi:ABC-type phosphate/phosphonate transport system ATPase subunit
MGTECEAAIRRGVVITGGEGAGKTALLGNLVRLGGKAQVRVILTSHQSLSPPLPPNTQAHSPPNAVLAVEVIY